MKIKLLINLIAFCFLSILEINAQDSENETNQINKSIFKFSYQPESHFNSKGAKKDIANDNIKILFAGGLMGIPDFNNEKDTFFQKKYSVKFYSQGCLRNGKNENEEAYNQTIFLYLDKRYGKVWRNEIRENVIGLK
ncbi:conserved exported protein of unknown function [Tenacibaculum sp. 190130A14a]|uniref:Uncharacterized protein n=1 Tax=Tenacibaculum polynesiense TaxID=3137857 RepID=A0ABP1F6A3_9FLAO